MKKTIFIVLIIVSMAFGDDENKTKLINEYIKKTELCKSMDNVKIEILPGLSKEGIKKVEMVFDCKNIQDKFHVLAQTNLSNDDLKKINDFYDTPFGKKIISESTIITKDKLKENMKKLEQYKQDGKLTKNRIILISELLSSLQREKAIDTTSRLILNIQNKYTKIKTENIQQDKMLAFVKAILDLEMDSIYQATFLNFSDVEIRDVIHYNNTQVGKKEIDIGYKLVEELNKQAMQ